MPSQAVVYESYVRPLVAAALNGYNACVVSYGQTGSGKTFTTFGPEGALEQAQKAVEEGRGVRTVGGTSGVVLRACEEVVALIQEEKRAEATAAWDVELRRRAEEERAEVGLNEEEDEGKEQRQGGRQRVDEVTAGAADGAGDTTNATTAPNNATTAATATAPATATATATDTATATAPAACMHTRTVFSVQYVEVYQEKVTDLLTGKPHCTVTLDIPLYSLLHSRYPTVLSAALSPAHCTLYFSH
jgi:hypothetical protein